MIGSLIEGLGRPLDFPHSDLQEHPENRGEKCQRQGRKDSDKKYRPGKVNLGELVERQSEDQSRGCKAGGLDYAKDSPVGENVPMQEWIFHTSRFLI